jgi:assimilatory nitrate reductase catalytic subunit
VRTTCPYCGVGCGVRATAAGDGAVVIAGDKAHPANAGRLCVKGSALGETIDLNGRLLHPAVREGGQLRRVSWDAALDKVAHTFAGIIAEHGPDSVALYVSGQLLTEDYYVANKLAKGYIGSANIDTNSRLCMSSSVAGHKRAFGRTSCRAATTTSSRPTWSCWPAPTWRGATRSCSSASRASRKRGPISRSS